MHKKISNNFLYLYLIAVQCGGRETASSCENCLNSCGGDCEWSGFGYCVIKLSLISEDTNPKRTCNGWGDCQHGERCHSISVGFQKEKSYCVPDTCRKNSDCPNVGNTSNGLIIGSGCDGGYCVYSEVIALGK